MGFALPRSSCKES